MAITKIFESLITTKNERILYIEWHIGGIPLEPEIY